MMPLERGFRQIIEVTGTRLASVFLAVYLYFIRTMLDHLCRIAVRTPNYSIRPPHITNGLEASRLIDQGTDSQKAMTIEGWLAHEYFSWTSIPSRKYSLTLPYATHV
jgi:hypothetical protein